MQVVTYNEELADINNDGETTVIDAMAIQLFLADIEVKFHIDEPIK